MAKIKRNDQDVILDEDLVAWHKFEHNIPAPVQQGHLTPRNIFTTHYN